MANLVLFWFLVCYAATQLATQLRQRCIQVVRSTKEARKRLTESNGTPAMDLGHRMLFLSSIIFMFCFMIVVLRVEFLLKTESGYLRDAEVT